MRVKKIQIKPHRDGTLIVSWGLGERGQTPVYGTHLVKTGNVRTALLDPAVQKKLGLRPDNA